MNIKVEVESDWNEFTGTYSWLWTVARLSRTAGWITVGRGRYFGTREEAIAEANDTRGKFIEHQRNKRYVEEMEV